MFWNGDSSQRQEGVVYASAASAQTVSVDQCTIIRTALHTADQNVAAEKAGKVERLQDLMWEAALAGRDRDAMALHDRLRNIAEMRGFTYLQAEDTALLSVDKILDRVGAAGTPTELDATLGAVKPARIALSDLFEEFTSLTEDRQV